MTEHNSDITGATSTGSTGVDPKAYFAALSADTKFPAVYVRVAHLRPAGTVISRVDEALLDQTFSELGFDEEDAMLLMQQVLSGEGDVSDVMNRITTQVTLDTDMWEVSGIGRLDQSEFVADLSGFDVLPFDSVRKLALPGVEVKVIRKGETFTNSFGQVQEAPCDGRIFFVSKEQVGDINTATTNGLMAAGTDGDFDEEALAEFALEVMRNLGMSAEDGYTFLEEELFQLHFGDEVPQGIALIRNGEPFLAAVLTEDVVFAFANEGDYPVKAGGVAFVNEHDVDGITVLVSPSSFVEHGYAPLI